MVSSRDPDPLLPTVEEVVEEFEQSRLYKRLLREMEDTCTASSQLNAIKSEANSFIDLWLTKSDRDFLRQSKTPEEAVDRLLPQAESSARKGMKSMRRAHISADRMLEEERYDKDMQTKLDDIIDYYVDRNLDRERAKEERREQRGRPPPPEPSRSPPLPPPAPPASTSTSSTSASAFKPMPASLPAKPSPALVEPPLMSRRSSRGSRSPPRDRLSPREHKSTSGHSRIGAGFRRVGSGRPQQVDDDRPPASGTGAAEERERTGLKRSRPSRWD